MNDEDEQRGTSNRSTDLTPGRLLANPRLTRVYAVSTILRSPLPPNLFPVIVLHFRFCRFFSVQGASPFGTERAADGHMGGSFHWSEEGYKYILE